ncbi:MAG TPA: HAMP domain-containing sensor histidine kinase [Candidatus Polarisedimenticolia bacterium]|nr:HAMP domain-containing sensor histidine kinase [Candidatus Polarisedimenticolia bacterium]
MKANPRPERFDALIEECLKEAAPRLAARSLSVTHQLGPNLPEYELDRGLMKEAVHCMLAEAIKAAADSGRLRVTLKANSNALMLAVKAPGSGLTEVQREMLFTGEVRPGTLAYARGIIAAHGGVAWANGMPGRGITFYLSLPIRRKA